ncbi:MAG: flagellar basal-body rod protein FlgG [Candidatus Marinimicrobia bacterium]|nr:flagellar basal-body rod protein FlgG [Candidatus Neomarinimicrobiota bacterium]
MIRSLTTAALGMSAQQLKVDTISNNLANVNTTGYKKSDVQFQDLMYQNIQSGNVDQSNNKEKPGTIQIGHGNKPIASFKTFTVGAIEETGNPLDIAINGKGFLQVLKPDGTIAFSRDGSLRMDNSGNLVNASGLSLYPEITIPDNAESVNISEDGIISVKYPDEIQPEEIGQIELATFINPAGLESIGGNLFDKTSASGEPVFSTPGDEGVGTIVQAYLEKSNVDIVKEMVGLIVAQRAYEINSKAIRTSDELLSMANNLKR